MKKILTIALALALVLGLAGTSMAASVKGNRGKSDTKTEILLADQPTGDELAEVEDVDDEVEGDADEDEAEEDKAEEDDAEEDNAEDGDLSQGAVHCALVIDYTVPGTDVGGVAGSGTMILTATRGDQVGVFTAEIPWGFTDEEAIAHITETFGPMVEEDFGLEVNSFKVIEYEFDEETSVTTVLLLAIHGKAPIRLEPKGLGKTVRSGERLTHTERCAVRAERVKAKGR